MNENESYESIAEGVSIFLRGDMWQVNYQFNRKQHRKSLGTKSKKEARRKALRLVAELLEDRHAPQRKPATVEEAVAAYDKYLQTAGRAPKTLQKYRKVFERVTALAEEMHRSNMLGIDISFTDEYRHRRVKEKVALITVYKEVMIIRQLVNFAFRRRLILVDPLAGIEIKEPKPNPQPCWVKEEVERILAASSGMQKLAFTILADTGMRVNEARHLTWEDIDLKRNLIHIRPKDNWRPKTGDQRAIPMSARLQAEFKSLKRRHRWVLTASPSSRYPEGGRQISERRLLRSLKRLLKKLKLPGKLHTFRHAFISHSLTTGIAEAVVRSWVGHVDRDVMKLYTHIADTHSQEAMRKLEALNGNSSDQQTRKEPENGRDSKDASSAQFQHTDENEANE